MATKSDDVYAKEEEDHQSSSSSDEEYDSDEYCDDDGHSEELYDDDDDGDGDCSYDNGNVKGGELGQHIAAMLVAVLAAVVTHSRIHGGYGAWREELSRDWTAFGALYGVGPTGGSERAADDDGGGAPFDPSSAPYHAAAPSMDAIPASERRRVLKRALGKDRRALAGGNDDEDGGHEGARNFRRTRGLSFCPTNGGGGDDVLSFSDGAAKALSATTADVSDEHGLHLAEMEFILPLEPSVRVLHSYYLADALGADSSFAYDSYKGSTGDATKDLLGSYSSDGILTNIESLLDDVADGGEGPTLEQIRSIVGSYLPTSMIDRQHSCLLHQYAINRSSGRSIRGTTRVYERPHVSTYYRSRQRASSSDNALAVVVEPNYKIPPASLTFTGYAAKFVNLSPKSVNLYWDGGRIPSGPRAGEMHTVLVGTIASMESIGTSSFPGHTFYLTPTYDKDHMLQRWTITEDSPISYYDPAFEDMSTDAQRTEMERLVHDGKWTEEQRFRREAWLVDRSFGRDYLIKTGRAWLANFPQPYLRSGDAVRDALSMFDNGAGAVQEGHAMHMWQADYIGQTHDVNTSNLYYNTLPERLERLTTEDYLAEAEEKRRLEMRDFQSSNLKETKDDGNAAMMSLNLKVISSAPRVLEVRKFLSPVEVQHLIDLASGIKGEVAMERSTVSASNVKGVVDNLESGKRVRGSQADARSSTGGWIHREQDAIVDTIFRRIADLLNIDERLMRDKVRDYPVDEERDGESLPTHDRIVEAMQLLRYGPGEEYAAHHDFTYPSIGNRYQPKRFATVLLYLTGNGDVIDNGVRRSAGKKTGGNGLKGGETLFPRAITTDSHDGVKVEPQSGKAIVFYNTLPDGNMDDLSQHSGGKVEKGFKYLANIWVWDPIVN